MNAKAAIQSQYLAALRMLKEAVVKCPPAMWDDPRDRDRFWFKAYHTVYYTHKYLQPSIRDFVRWQGRPKPKPGHPISKAKLLEYLEFVQQEVLVRVPKTNLAGPSGFYGSRMDKLEFTFVNIRHIQQHTGELYERLGSRADAKLTWADHVYRKTE